MKQMIGTVYKCSKNLVDRKIISEKESLPVNWINIQKHDTSLVFITKSF